MKTQKVVGQWINCLTQDEDLRQDLWVHYLSGHTLESFPSRLEEIIAEYSDEHQVRQSIQDIITYPPSDEFIEFLNTFSEFERSIICHLMLGFDIEHISNARGISEVRIRQTIATIRYNPTWENYHGTKEEPIRRRAIRTNRRRD